MEEEKLLHNDDPLLEKLLVEPTAEEIKAVEHLPYLNLQGVVQNPSNDTKLEMKYAMSILSRHRTKWGLNHFRILMKSLEYGWSTRKMGLKYNSNAADKDKKSINSVCRLVVYITAVTRVPANHDEWCSYMLHFKTAYYYG